MPTPNARCGPRGPPDVELVGVGVPVGIAIAAPTSLGDERARRDPAAADLHVHRRAASSLLERRVVAQDLLDGGLDQVRLRLLTEQCQLVGVAQQGENAGRDERRRRLVAGGHQRDRRRDDLVLGQHAALGLRRDETAEQVVSRMATPLVDRLAEPRPRLEERVEAPARRLEVRPAVPNNATMSFDHA